MTNFELVAQKTAYCILIIFGLIIAFSGDLNAQCAMCRATLETNVSNGEIGMADSLNTGILYLFVMPYLLVATIGYMWYKKSRENVGQGYSFR